MTYCCDTCGFLFFRSSEVRKCSSCVGQCFHPAAKAESERLQQLLIKNTKPEEESERSAEKRGDSASLCGK